MARPPLVGRERELGVLDDLVDHVGERGGALVMSGEAGIGKSALLEPLAAQTPSSWFHAGMRYARPLLADDREAEPLFQTALDADLARWPVLRARLQLAYGAWLRRRRRVAESRAPLRAARDAFDALGAVPWGSGPARSSAPPARPAAAAPPRRGTGSAPRSCRSPSWPPTGCPTGRSASSSTVPTARSARTCTGASPSSASAPGPSSGPCWTPPRPRTPSRRPASACASRRRGCWR